MDANTDDSFFLIAFIFFIMEGIIRLKEFIKYQNINEYDPNLSFIQESKLCNRYERSINPKQKEYLNYI